MGYFHELAMENSWNSSDQEAIEFPWKTHGEFIWAKSHGKLIGYFHGLAMESSWNSNDQQAMECPWKNNGEFVWVKSSLKTHGLLSMS